MLRYLRLSAAFLVLLFVPALAAAQKQLVFEISFPKELSAAPVDGRVLLIISKDARREPRFGVAEGIESQQVFGVDVETWQPGAVARVDSSTLGYPLESLRNLPPGDYFVQAVLNIYEIYQLG